MAKIKWKRDYGDGYETDDSVLWINNKPTNNSVCCVSGGCYYAYVNNKEIGVFSTLKEAKEEILKEVSK